MSAIKIPGFSQFPHIRIALTEYDADEFSRIITNSHSHSHSHLRTSDNYALITFTIKENSISDNIKYIVVVKRETVNNYIHYTCYANDPVNIESLDNNCHYGILNHVINSLKEQQSLLEAFIKFITAGTILNDIN
jgi:hypothetical protein